MRLNGYDLFIKMSFCVYFSYVENLSITYLCMSCLYCELW